MSLSSPSPTHGEALCPAVRLHERLSILWMAPVKSLWASHHFAWVFFLRHVEVYTCPVPELQASLWKRRKSESLYTLNGDSEPFCRQTGLCLPWKHSQLSTSRGTAFSWQEYFAALKRENQCRAENQCRTEGDRPLRLRMFLKGLSDSWASVTD